MVWQAAVAAAAGNVIGGIYTANKQAKEASKARDWSAQQYGQRYQVTMRDMRRAGLNPMLAYSQGPGQSPTGTAADMSAMGRGFAAGGEIIARAQLRGSQAKQADSAAELNKNQASLATATEVKTKAEAENVRQQTAESRQRQALMFQQGITEGSRQDLFGAQAKQALQQVKQSRSQIELIQKQTGKTKVEIDRALAELTKFQAVGRSFVGDLSHTAVQILLFLAELTGSIKVTPPQRNQ